MTDKSPDAASRRAASRERLAVLRFAARTLAESLAGGEGGDWDALRALAEGASRKTFATTCERLGFLGGAALAGRSDVVEWLLAAGVGPNVYVSSDHHRRRWCDFPLHVLSGAPQDDQTLRCLELLVRAGASVGQVSPPEDYVRTSWWRLSALDVAIRARQPAAVEALLPHADAATREAALVAAIVATANRDADRAWLLSLIARLPVAPASTRFGIHALHAAALVADLDVWDAIAPRAVDPNPPVQIEQSFREFALPNTGASWPSVGLRAGATPLDVIDTMRGLFGSAIARVARDRAASPPGDRARYSDATYTAKLAALDEMARRAQSAGGVSGGAAALPPAIAEVERDLARVAQSLGTLDRWRVAVAAVDLAGKGPLGFLVTASELARDAFAGLKRPDAHLLGSFLTGRLPATLILGPSLGREERVGIPREKLVWPKDYPPEAAPLFDLAFRYPSALLGRDGDAILGATVEAGGTMLWRVTRRRVEKLSDFLAWVRQGVDALLGEAVSAP